MIHANQITNLQIVKRILDGLKPYNSYINTLNENSYEYEDMCENITFQLCEIEEVLIGKEKYNSENIARADIRIMSYWKYLNGKISFEKLLKNLNEESDGLLLK
jgi:hypothetical protein